MAEDNVIQFPVGEPDRPSDESAKPLFVSKRNYKACRHDEHTGDVDRDARTVTCGGCGVDLDPFEALLWCCRPGDRLEDVRAERRTLVKEIEELTAEERRLKSRVRAWRKKAEVC